MFKCSLWTAKRLAEHSSCESLLGSNPPGKLFVHLRKTSLGSYTHNNCNRSWCLPSILGISTEQCPEEHQLNKQSQMCGCNLFTSGSASFRKSAQSIQVTIWPFVWQLAAFWGYPVFTQKKTSCNSDVTIKATQVPVAACSLSWRAPNQHRASNIEFLSPKHMVCDKHKSFAFLDFWTSFILHTFIIQLYQPRKWIDSWHDSWHDSTVFHDFCCLPLFFSTFFNQFAAYQPVFFIVAYHFCVENVGSSPPWLPLIQVWVAHGWVQRLPGGFPTFLSIGWWMISIRK